MARKTEIKWGPNTTELEGEEVKVGQKAPDFTVIDNDQKAVSLKDTSGVRIFCSAPSLDTPTCDRETRKFNEEASKIPGVSIYVVTMDLPFAQKRWCGAAGIDKVKTLSDHRKASFGVAYGVLQPEKRLMARAVFVVDKNDNVTYVEYVPVVGEEPKYEPALAAAKQASA